MGQSVTKSRIRCPDTFCASGIISRQNYHARKVAIAHTLINQISRYTQITSRTCMFQINRAFCEQNFQNFIIKLRPRIKRARRLFDASWFFSTCHWDGLLLVLTALTGPDSSHWYWLILELTTVTYEAVTKTTAKKRKQPKDVLNNTKRKKR